MRIHLVRRLGFIVALSAASIAVATPAADQPAITSAKPILGAAVEKPLTPAMMPMLVTDLIIHDTLVGNGEGAKTGQALSVHYTGWLYDATKPGGKGKKFDSSLDRNERFPITLGVSRVIEGWTTGLEGMKTGGKLTLIIPARLGYGNAGAGGVIPPKASLLFEIELFSINGSASK